MKPILIKFCLNQAGRISLTVSMAIATKGMKIKIAVSFKRGNHSLENIEMLKILLTAEEICARLLERKKIQPKQIT